MQLPKNAVVAVADGSNLNLFHNVGDEGHPALTALPSEKVAEHHQASPGHHSSSANPGESQVGEDGFAAGVAELLNRHALEGKMAGLVVVAAPRMLGELRRHYHAKLQDLILGEISKDLVGHAPADILKAIAAA